MKKWHWALLALFTVALLWGVSTLIVARQGESSTQAALPDELRSVLDRSQKFELLALYPHTKEEGSDKWKALRAAGKKEFHGFLIIDKSVITDPAEKRNILSALYKSMIEAQHNAGNIMCFEPRHGIRATWQNQTVDLVICFHCHQFIAYKDGKRWGNDLPITDSARADLDESLNRAGIKNPY